MSRRRPLDPVKLLQNLRYQHCTDRIALAAITNAIEHLIGCGRKDTRYHNPRHNHSLWQYHYQNMVIWRNALERMHHEH